MDKMTVAAKQAAKSIGLEPSMNMVPTDPLAKAIARARKGNPVDTLNKLLAEESRWKRKRTIAENKLADVREQLNQFAKDIALVNTDGVVK